MEQGRHGCVYGLTDGTDLPHSPLPRPGWEQGRFWAGESLFTQLPALGVRGEGERAPPRRSESCSSLLSDWGDAVPALPCFTDSC